MKKCLEIRGLIVHQVQKGLIPIICNEGCQNGEIKINNVVEFMSMG